MVEHLGDQLEETWREQLAGSNLHELFPKDETIARHRQALQENMRVLKDFKACMSKAIKDHLKGSCTVVEASQIVLKWCWDGSSLFLLLLILLGGQ